MHLPEPVSKPAFAQFTSTGLSEHSSTRLPAWNKRDNRGPNLPADDTRHNGVQLIEAQDLLQKGLPYSTRHRESVSRLRIPASKCTIAILSPRLVWRSWD
jgi:hypothetical protein